MKESTKILIITSLISSIGGIGLESVEEKIILLLPLLILLPALNNLIGSFGTVISSRISTMLYMGSIKDKKLWASHKAGNLFIMVGIIAFISSLYISLLASAIAALNGFSMNAVFLLEVMVVTVVITLFLVVLIFWVSATAGMHIFRHDMDPDNYLIPITTSIADLGSMLMMSAAIVWIF